MIRLPESYKVLVVDDEPDMHLLTEMALRRLRYRGKPVEMLYAETAEEALQCLQDHADIAVLLLDVVMESEHAGLKLCQRIREELHNDEVRILLRTGQPGAAPEKKVIENYEIDGYLSKAEMTQTRLYTAVRTALKAFTELRRAQRLEETLFFLHQSSLILDSHVGTEETLQQVLETTAQLAGVPFALIYAELAPPEEGLEAERYLLSTAASDYHEAESRSAELLECLMQGKNLDKGLLLTLSLPESVGTGWIFLDGEFETDPLLDKMLPLIASHATQLLYRNRLQ